MNIALYKSIEYGFVHVYEVCDHAENDPDRVRVSETLDIEFPVLSHEEAVKKEIAKIDTRIEAEMARSEVKINSFKARKAELLAIGHDK